MVIHFKSDNNTFHNIVASYLTQQGGKKIEKHDREVEIIAEAALSYLKTSCSPIKHWKHKKLNNKEQLLLRQALKHVVISSKTPWVPGIKTKNLSAIQNLLFMIMRGNVPPAKELLKKEYLLAVVWKKNPEILREARELVNQVFADITQQMNKKKLSPAEIFHMEMIIGDLLSLYPFLSPEQDEILSVPTEIEGKWKLVEYSVDRIPLTPDWMGSPLMAFGLIPKKSNLVPPLLLFKGTTYPTDEGFGLSLMTDINPFGAVGKYGFNLGKNKISKWLKTNTVQSKAKIYGKSLGGALAWQTALHFPAQVDKVATFGAPGLTSADLRRLQRLKKENNLPLINMFCQEKDPVIAVDHVASSGIHYYQVVGKHSRKGIGAHADMYSTHEKSTIIRLDPNQEKRRWMRLGMTITRQIASLTLFPLLISLYETQIAVVQTGKRLQRLFR
jgi:hypothetical protein